MEPAYKLLTVAEFLNSCPNDDRHYQLIDGVIVAMAPPAIAHQRIAGESDRRNLRIFYAQTGRIARSAVRPGLRRRVWAGRNYFETDIVVTCQFANDYRGINAEPLLIVEILSPSTERDDHFVKLPQYGRSPASRKSSTSKASLWPRRSIAATPPETGR